MTWYNDTNVQAAITQFLTWVPDSTVADINRHLKIIQLAAPSLRHLYRVVGRMVESGALKRDAVGFYVKRPLTKVLSNKRNVRENPDVKAIVTGYVLGYPGINAQGIVRKVRALNIPQPSTAEIYDLINDIVDEHRADYV